MGRVLAVLCALSNVALTAACSKSSSVTAPSPSKTVSSVTLGGSTTVSAGATSQLTATAVYSDQTTGLVSSQATWTSSDTATATVSATGLLTALRAGTVDVSATYQGVVGRRTIQISPAQFRVTVALQSITALSTCDDFTQGLTQGEFAYQVKVVDPTGATATLAETNDYPGDPAAPRGENLSQGESVNLSTSRAYTMSGTTGQSLRVEFRATEWDSQIVIFPPSTRAVHDSDMDNRLGTRTHSYSNGTWTNTGPGSITLGASGCQIRLNYSVTATQL